MNSDSVQGIACKGFSGLGSGQEYFISVQPDCDLDFATQIAQTEERYAAVCAELGLDEDTAIFRRIFVSDMMNQARTVRDSSLARAIQENPVAVSLVQQTPLPGAKIALLAYHIAGDATLAKRRLSRNDILVKKQGRRHLWTTGLCASEAGDDASPTEQTRAVFGNLIDGLKREGGALRDNCVRTWIYLKDVDVFYQAMVRSRGEIFAENGLSKDTHFIASTGIEGACAHRYDLIAMDAYSVLDLDRRQVSYLNDFSRLCATHEYDVHFERGTRIAYADRAHYFISGTASIDRRGEVLHGGNVLRQFDVAIENVEALLRAGGANLADLMQLTVYLRDPTDFARISGSVDERFAGLPVNIVQGAVCRPQWLVEVECIAIAANDAPSLPPF